MKTALTLTGGAVFGALIADGVAVTLERLVGRPYV